MDADLPAASELLAADTVPSRVPLGQALVATATSDDRRASENTTSVDRWRRLFRGGGWSMIDVSLHRLAVVRPISGKFW